MIKYLEGDLFSTPAQTIVNTVNTVGVMGKGIALEFKKRYPDMFSSYRSVCEKHRFNTGQLMLFYEKDHWVLLFPTKQHWRNPSRLEYIEDGLIKFRDKYAEKGITSIAFPRLGCGNGELSWNDVKLVMEKYLNDLPIDIYIYLKNDDGILPEHKTQKEMEKWLKTNAKDLSFQAVEEDVLSRCSIVPYLFDYNGNTSEIRFEGDFIVETKGTETIRFSEERFFECWDVIRGKGVFPYSDNVFNVISALLCSLGYLTKIKMIEEDNTSIDGYQVNEGLNRKFVLGE